MAGPVPAIHALPYHGTKNVAARAFASPKRLRPRRRDNPDLTTSPEESNHAPAAFLAITLR